MQKRSLRALVVVGSLFNGLTLSTVTCSSDDTASPPDPSDNAAPTEPAPAPSPPPSPVAVRPGLSLGAASRSACFIDAEGALRCWGDNRYGQLGGPATSKPQQRPDRNFVLPPVAQVALGARHTCALLRDGAVRCFGEDATRFGRADNRGLVEISGLGQVIELVAGSEYTCALATRYGAREVSCWGKIPGTEEIVPSISPRRIEGLSPTRIAGSSRAVCAVLTSGAVSCFGDNQKSAILPQGPERVVHPTEVPRVAGAVDVALSDDGTCIVNRDGVVECWGERSFSAYAPWSVYGIEGAVSITGGASGHFCALMGGGKLTCFGGGDTGAIGGRRSSFRNAIDGSWTEARAGLDFACGQTADGAVRCWGTNSMGQLAQRFEESVTRPMRLDGIEGAKGIAASRDATCVILADSVIRCYGPDARDSQYDDAGSYDLKEIMRADALLMSGGFEPMEDSLGIRPSFVACAFTGDLPTCWGDNRASHLITQDAVSIYRPWTISSMRGGKAFAFGAEHACSLAEDGVVMCWGGLGKTRALPAKVAGVTDAAAIALGADEGCALLGDGSAACFPLRDPAKGSIGPARFTASRVVGVRGMTSIAHGRRHACAIDLQGGVTCWGPGERGALAKVAGVTGAVELALGDDFGCARRKDGHVSCWGKNDAGQLGDGTIADRAEAAEVDDLNDVTAIRAGARHACAMTKEGEVFCWGDNRLRVIEQGSPLISRAPMTVSLNARR